MIVYEFKRRNFTLYHAGKELGGVGWVNGDKKYTGFVGAVYFEAPKRSIALAALKTLGRAHAKLGRFP